jgi:hypothetical protein
VTISTTRQPLFVVDTPMGSAPKVICYLDTYKLHLPIDRKQPGLLQAAKDALSSPDAIVAGTTTPDHLAFVNQNFTSPVSNHPLVVFVDPKGNPMAAVASMGFRRDFKDLERHTVLWIPPKC